jgi:hypothetical protein
LPPATFVAQRYLGIPNSALPFLTNSTGKKIKFWRKGYYDAPLALMATTGAAIR